jgi:tRNA(Ile)-lysidine synthase
MDIVNKFENKVSSFLKDYAQGVPLFVAVSGGADSMALLAAVCALSKQSIIRNPLFVIHVEHGLREAEESNADADFVRMFCEANEIKCCVEHIKPGKIAAIAKRRGTGIEAAARYFRRKAFLKEVRRINCHEKVIILLAHTKNDMLETALMRILRGAGPAGLAAMPVENKGQETSSFCIRRPLLSMSRTNVIDYLKAKDIPWREDSTNTDEKFLRNRIRCRLVPLLNEAFSSWETGIAALSQTQSLTADFLEDEAKNRIRWELAVENLSLFTAESNFFAQPQIIREEALFQGINTLSQKLDVHLQSKSIKRSVIRRFCAGTLKDIGLGCVRIRREGGKILLSHMKKEFFECGFSRLIKGPSLDNL